MPWREKEYHCGGHSWRGGLFTKQLKKWVKAVFLLGCYECIFHGTGNSAQLCRNFGISGWCWTPQTPPRYATGCVWYRNLIYEEPDISQLWLNLRDLLARGDFITVVSLQVRLPANQPAHQLIEHFVLWLLIKKMNFKENSYILGGPVPGVEPGTGTSHLFERRYNDP